MPEIGEGVIEVDLDIDCQSAWLQDPFIIDMSWQTDAIATGPEVVQALRADCAQPSGITEKIVGVAVELPLSLPAYEPVAVDFTFTSREHATEASITHTAQATIVPDGVPAVEVAAFESNGTIAYIALDNVGNDDVTIEWQGYNGTVLLNLPEVTIPRGGTWQGNITGDLEPGQTIAIPLQAVPFDSKGKEGPAEQVILEFSVAHEPVESKGVPAPFLVPLAILLATRLRR